MKSLQNPNNENVDVLIVTVPWVNTLLPLMAPAAIKPSVESLGLTCFATDPNIDFVNRLKDHPLKNDFIDLALNDRYQHDETITLCLELVEELLEDILSWNPKFLALSLFSYGSQRFTKWLTYLIKKERPDIKIIIGGSGCLDTLVGRSDFLEFMLENKLADWHVRGDGERSLYELLQGNENYSGINSNSWTEITKEELAELAIPDYDDYKFDAYELKALPVIGSRGCVRKCTYCDFIENWKTFAWRTADDIFNEMVIQYNRYGLRRFKFQDTLTNGNMNEFVSLMELMAEYNTNNPGQEFSWAGYYIFRNVNKNTDKEWELISRSGVERLIVGIENFNQDIRYLVGKKFTNEAIDYHLEKAYEYNIKMSFLNIVGYVSETEKHVDFIKEWLRTHTKYNHLIGLVWGCGLGIFPNTYLDRHKEELGIVMPDDQPLKWHSVDNSNNPKLRVRWIKELNALSKELGFAISDLEDNHLLIEALLNEK